MDLPRIKTFFVVARTLNFTRAAEELAMGQSAVSYQIKSLENELGAKLFVRDRRKISLTREGKLVFEYADRLLRQVQEMRDDIAGSGNPDRGLVRLGAITRGLGSPFIQLRQAWNSKNGDIELSFNAEMRTKTILEKVRNGKTDVGFITSRESIEDVVTIPWGDFEMIMVAGQAHPLAKQEPVLLEHIQYQDWLFFEHGSWLCREADQFLARYNIRPAGVYESNDGTVLTSLVKEGKGISLMPEWGIQEEVKDGSFKMISVEGVFTKIPVFLVVSASGHSQAVNTFLEFLLDTNINEMINRKNQRPS